MDAKISETAKILHQDERHAAFIFFPKVHKGLELTRQLALVRRIEDRLIANRVNIEKEVNLHYEISDRHGSDTRTLTHRCRPEPSAVPRSVQWLAFGATFVASLWGLCELGRCVWRGALGAISLG